MKNLTSVPRKPGAKVTVIGAGNVGSALAKRILDGQAADVVILDVVPDRAQGIALDLSEARGLERQARSITGTHHYHDTADSDIVVITAGLPRKPGMSRDDLLQVNGRIMKEVITQAIIHSPQARYIVVTNPLDVMTDLAWRVSGLPAQQVMGMAGVLDTARFCTFIAMELGVPVEDVSALVLGGHGDLMVPLSGCASVSGIPLRQLLDQETINRLIERTQYGGAEIVELLKTGGAYQAPAAAVYQMVEAILLNRHRILPIATYLTGQYGLFDVFLGVPAQLGWLGVESVMEVVLTDEERAALHQSALIVKSHMEKIAHCWQPPTQLMLS